MNQVQISSRLTRKNKKTIKVWGIALVIILQIISLSFLIFYKNTEYIGNVIGTITMIIDFLGVICIGYELEMSQRIQEAQFIFELNHAFVENVNITVRRSRQSGDRKSTRLNSSHTLASRMPSSA